VEPLRRATVYPGKAALKIFIDDELGSFSSKIGDEIELATMTALPAAAYTDRRWKSEMGDAL
jgi:hypothetical protein